MLAAILVVPLLAVVGAVGIHLLSGGSIRSFVAQPRPSAGEPAIEVDYEVNLNCAVPFSVGDTIWKFVGGGWPQEPQGVWIFQAWSNRIESAVLCA